MAESNRTEKATPKKKRDERKKGNVFQSKDATSVVTVLVAFILLSKLCGFDANRIANFYKSSIARIGTMDDISVTGFSVIFRDLIVNLLICVFPLMIAVALVAIIANGAQTKFNFSMERLKPKLSKFNPIEGFKRIVSIRSAVQLVKSIIKVVVIGVVIYSAVSDVLLVAPDMLNTEAAESTSYMLSAMMSMVYKICLMFLAVAILDYVYERFDYERRMRMTKQEVKEEYKQTEGDPQVKGKQREIARKMSMNRMIQAIPTADVIVRNPTHFAVALKYDEDSMTAPVVVAKGADKLAERIIAEAEKYDIPMYENRPLAHTLYYEKGLDPGMPIPPELYRPVVEVFVWLMQYKGIDLREIAKRKAVS